MKRPGHPGNAVVTAIAACLLGALPVAALHAGIPPGPVAITTALLLIGVLALALLRARAMLARELSLLNETRTALAERIKEKACIHSVFRASEDPGKPLDDLVRDVAEALPPGWRYPGICLASVDIEGARHETGNITREMTQLSVPVPVDGTLCGKITVAHADARPFLPEERQLIDQVAERLAETVRRRRAEQKLQESREQFRTLFEKTSLPNAIIDRKGACIAANEAYLGLLGLSATRELLGRPPTDFSPELQPDGEASAVKAGRLIAEAMERGSLRFDWRHRRPDETPVLAEVILTRLSQEGNATLHCTARDITEQRRIEDELARQHLRLEAAVAERTRELSTSAAALRLAMASQKAIFDATAEGIFFLRGDTIVECNHPLESLLGYATDELKGRRIQDWLPDTDDFRIVSSGIAAALDNQVRYEEHLQIQRKDGKLLWCRLSIRALDPAEPARGAVGTLVDVTVEHETVDQLNRARALAEQASTMKSRFVANMSHEIRTPINAIVGIAHLLQGSGLDGKPAEHVERLLGATRTLLALVSDMLDFSRLEAGATATEESPFDVGELVRSVAMSGQRAAAAKGIALAWSLAGDIPGKLFGDARHLAQILRNYINNAIKFTDRGRIDITVTLVDVDADAVVLRFDVIDTGIGIEAEKLPQLFQSFWQADDTMARKYGGTGLGLAICKQLAERFHGDVGVDSMAGKGARFWCTVQLKSVATRECEEAPMPSAPPYAGSSGRLPAGKKILVVGASGANRDVARDVLSAADADVAVASDGLEALGLVGQQHFDAILMDLQTPLMDGFATASAIRELPGQSALPLIALSANPSDRERCTAAGVADFVATPINPAQLIGVLGKWLAGAGQPPVALGLEPRAASSPSGLDEFRGIAGLDVERGLMLVGGRQSLYRTILEKFTTSEADFTARLTAQVMSGNRGDAVRTAHTLKGAAGQIGAGDLQAAAAELEQVLRTEAASPEPWAAMRRTEANLSVLLAALTRRPGPSPHAPIPEAPDSFDQAQFDAVCDRLEGHLAGDEYASNEIIAEHTALLRAGLGEHFSWIAEAVDNFNYPAALDWLREARSPGRDGSS